jgi:hypothetical protein
MGGGADELLQFAVAACEAPCTTFEFRLGQGAVDCAAAAEAGVDPSFYVYRDRSNDVTLPWDVIDGGVKSAFYRSEFDKGLREEWTLPPKRAAENIRLLPMAR